MFSPECRDYLKSRKPSQREQEIAKLEKQADKKHDIEKPSYMPML